MAFSACKMNNTKNEPSKSNESAIPTCWDWRGSILIFDYINDVGFRDLGMLANFARQFFASFFLFQFCQFFLLANLLLPFFCQFFFFYFFGLPVFFWLLFSHYFCSPVFFFFGFAIFFFGNLAFFWAIFYPVRSDTEGFPADFLI